MKLRKLELKDLPSRVEWMNHPKVYQSMHFDVPVLLEKTKQWFDNVKKNPNRSDVVFEEEGMLVGMGGLTNINRLTGKAELYVFINPNLQAGGLGTKAVEMLCRFGFDELKLNKIYLETNENNYAAIRVYEKCGFLLEGALREEYLSEEGQLLNRLYFGLLKKEFHE